MRIKTVFQIILIANWCLTCIVYFSSEPNTWVNLESLVYLSCLTAILSIALACANRVGLPLMLVLAIYAFQKYCFSPFYLFLIQQDTAGVDFTTFSIHSSSDYNVFLRYSVLGLLATASGLFLGTRSNLRFGFNRNRVNHIRDLLKDRLPQLSYPIIVILCVVFASITLYEFFVLAQRSILTDDTVITGAETSRWYRIFLRTGPTRHLVFCLLLFNWEYMKRRDKFLLFVPLILSAGTTILQGERSYFYVMALMLMWCCALKYGNPRIRGKWFRLAFIMGLLSLVTYPLATGIRAASRWMNVTNQVPTFEVLSVELGALYGNASNAILPVLTSVFGRLTDIETGLVIMNNKNINPFGDLLYVSTVVKRTLNALWPGDLFPGVMRPQYLFDHIYYDLFLGFNAHAWGLWEQFYLIFGYWSGLAWMFVAMVCVGVSWQVILFSKSPFKTFYLTTFIYFLWLMLMNFDVSYVFGSFLVELIVFNIMIRVLIVGSMPTGKWRSQRRLGDTTVPATG
jgi:hypothetical protein